MSIYVDLRDLRFMRFMIVKDSRSLNALVLDDRKER